MRIDTKKISTIMLLSALTVALIMTVANHLVLKQIRAEALRQAGVQQESSLKTFWELLNQKGKDFRVRDGALLAGNYVVNGNNEIPDKVLEITGNRATVFMGCTRVATNVLLADGRRAIGTRLVGPACDAIFRKGAPYRGESLILGIPYFTAYDPIRNARGEIIGAIFVGVKQDEYLARFARINLAIRVINFSLAAVFAGFALLLIWERKRSQEGIQEQLKFLQVLSDTIPSPIFSKDADGRYNGCNKGYLDLVGLTRDELIGKTAYDIWPRELADSYQQMDRELPTKGARVFESQIRYADGTLHDVIFNKATYVDMKGARGGVAGVILDITERKAAEEERNRLETQSHHSRMMESLMVQLGHDLKTPLTPLIALLPLVQKHIGDPKLAKMLEICQVGASRIQGIAEKSLDLVRLSSEANRSQLVPVTLTEAAQGAIGEISAALVQRGVSCHNRIDPNLQVLGAAGQLTLLFENLLSNAARYAAANGTIRLEASLHEGMVQVAVEDDGIGLDQDYTSLIFCEFFKADAARNDLNTQGLGLAICQRIVLNHGGRIWAQSPGKGLGTTFFFTLRQAQDAPSGDLSL